MAEKFNPSGVELTDNMVALNRVSKTVKGGRIQRFAAVMVVGDGEGHVGYGLARRRKFPKRSARRPKTLKRI